MLAETPTYTAAELVTIISVIMGGVVTAVPPTGETPITK
jgi:hypothetical protein